MKVKASVSVSAKREEWLGAKDDKGNAMFYNLLTESFAAAEGTVSVGVHHHPVAPGSGSSHLDAFPEPDGAVTTSMDTMNDILGNVGERRDAVGDVEREDTMRPRPGEHFASHFDDDGDDYDGDEEGDGVSATSPMSMSKLLSDSEDLDDKNTPRNFPKNIIPTNIPRRARRGSEVHISSDFFKRNLPSPAPGMYEEEPTDDAIPSRINLDDEGDAAAALDEPVVVVVVPPTVSILNPRPSITDCDSAALMHHLTSEDPVRFNQAKGAPRNSSKLQKKGGSSSKKKKHRHRSPAASNISSYSNNKKQSSEQEPVPGSSPREPRPGVSPVSRSSLRRKLEGEMFFSGVKSDLRGEEAPEATR